MPGTWIDKIVGNCRIEQKIGEGGCGQVFRGLDLMLDRAVAIKVLHPALAERSDVSRRFRSEAHMLARLSHPNVATLYSFHRDGDAHLMVMEFVEGETLEARLQRDGAMSVAQALPLLVQAFDGIQHAHRLGIVHRDLKSSNLMVSADDVVKVMDFGVARAVGNDGLTRVDQPIGTPEYMSPEQVRGDEIDARSDIYSLGVLIFKLLSGALPITGPSPFEVMRAQVDSEPKRLRDVVPDIPETFDRAVERALQKDPADRFPNVEALRDAVAGPHAATERTTGVPSVSRPCAQDLAPTALIPVDPPPWRNRARSILFAAALTSLCLGVGWHGERSSARASERASESRDPFVPVVLIAPPPTPAWARPLEAAPLRAMEVTVAGAEPAAAAPAPSASPEPPASAPGEAADLAPAALAPPGWVIRR